MKDIFLKLLRPSLLDPNLMELPPPIPLNIIKQILLHQTKLSRFKPSTDFF